MIRYLLTSTATLLLLFPTLNCHADCTHLVFKTDKAAKVPHVPPVTPCLPRQPGKTENAAWTLLSNVDPELTLEHRTQTLNGALDLFFSGQLEEAHRALIDFTSKGIKNGYIFIGAPTIRKQQYDAYLYLAQIEKERGNQQQAQKQQQLAVQLAPDITPTTDQFPPWLCKQVNNLRQAVQSLTDNNGPSNTVAATLLPVWTDPKSCHWNINGNRVPLDQLPADADADTYVRLECDGQHSLIYHRTAPDKKGSFTPLPDIGLIPENNGGTVFHRAPTAKLTDSQILSYAQTISETKNIAQSLVSIERGHNWQHFLLNSNERAVTDVTTGFISPQDSRPRPWFKDAPAWITGGTGAVMLLTGLVIGQKYGVPHPTEPAAWTLQLGGLALMGTALTLFLIPDQTTDTVLAGVSFHHRL